jgi:hypothetical protein
LSDPFWLQFDKSPPENEVIAKDIHLIQQLKDKAFQTRGKLVRYLDAFKVLVEWPSENPSRPPLRSELAQRMVNIDSYDIQNESYETRIRQYWKNMCVRYAADPLRESCWHGTNPQKPKSLCPEELQCSFGEGLWNLATSLSTKNGDEDWHRNRMMQIKRLTQTNTSCSFVLQMSKAEPSNTKSDQVRLECSPAPANTFHAMFTSRVTHQCDPVEYEYKHSTMFGKADPWTRTVQLEFLENGLVLVHEDGDGDGGQFEAVFERRQVDRNPSNVDPSFVSYLNSKAKAAANA